MGRCRCFPGFARSSTRPPRNSREVPQDGTSFGVGDVANYDKFLRLGLRALFTGMIRIISSCRLLGVSIPFPDRVGNTTVGQHCGRYTPLLHSSRARRGTDGPERRTTPLPQRGRRESRKAIGLLVVFGNVVPTPQAQRPTQCPRALCSRSSHTPARYPPPKLRETRSRTPLARKRVPSASSRVNSLSK